MIGTLLFVPLLPQYRMGLLALWPHCRVLWPPRQTSSARPSRKVSSPRLFAAIAACVAGTVVGDVALAPPSASRAAIVSSADYTVTAVVLVRFSTSGAEDWRST